MRARACGARVRVCARNAQLPPQLEALRQAAAMLAALRGVLASCGGHVSANGRVLRELPQGAAWRWQSAAHGVRAPPLCDRAPTFSIPSCLSAPPPRVPACPARASALITVRVLSGPTEQSSAEAVSKETVSAGRGGREAGTAAAALGGGGEGGVAAARVGTGRRAARQMMAAGTLNAGLRRQGALAARYLTCAILCDCRRFWSRRGVPSTQCAGARVEHNVGRHAVTKVGNGLVPSVCAGRRVQADQAHEGGS
jgi:hypothetical protein